MSDLDTIDRDLATAATRLTQLAESDVRIREELAQVDRRIEAHRTTFNTQMANFWRDTGDVQTRIRTAETERADALRAGATPRITAAEAAVATVRGELDGILRTGQGAIQPVQDQMNAAITERAGVEARLKANAEERAKQEAERKRLEELKKKTGNPTHLVRPKISKDDVAKNGSVAAAAGAVVKRMRDVLGPDHHSLTVYDAHYTGAIGVRSKSLTPDETKLDEDWMKDFGEVSPVVAAEEKKK